MMEELRGYGNSMINAKNVGNQVTSPPIAEAHQQKMQENGKAEVSRTDIEDDSQVPSTSDPSILPCSKLANNSLQKDLKSI
ncbi:hypothetical protein L6452_37407 [Arctium lappa]|uniref:Uncharacterized protein n=1 Tax=Arctium lappa TaxID=4217 RepID=A0ACB8Y2X4_ARCLA|nr:hypothetical protein L6452_37407 [Arctium lappa]